MVYKVVLKVVENKNYDKEKVDLIIVVSIILLVKILFIVNLI